MSQGVRVCVLGSAAVPHTGRWARALAERGLAVRVLSLERPAADDAALDLIEVVPSSPLPGAVRYPLASGRVRAALDAFRPDVVDAHFVPNYGLIGAILRRRPLVVNAWGSDLLAARDPLRRARLSWVLGRADHVRVDAENLARAARRLGVPEERLEVLPWGAEIDRFAFSADAGERRAARGRWPEELRQAAGDSPVVVSTRMHHPVYALDTLIDAWDEVSRALPAARCLVAGDGPLRGALEARARRGTGAASIAFLGRRTQEELARLLAGADVYVSTSRSDSTSLSLLEAMAAGAFPVVTDIEGNREWVGAGTASIFAPGDAAALSRGLVWALTEPGRTEAARRTNRATVEARGDWRRAMDRAAASTVEQAFRARLGR